MHKPIMRKIDVTEAYQTLPTLSGSFDISTLPTNTGTVYFLGDDGSDVPWVPGEYHSFAEVNLEEFQIKGTAGNVVTVIGGSM
jgi:hypothetical protein